VSPYHLSWFSWYWLAWILAFLVPELYFVFVNPLGTLSDSVWALEHLDVTAPFDWAMWNATHWAIAILVWLTFAWLSVHIPFGLLR
jgi:hypothetical protein